MHDSNKVIESDRSGDENFVIIIDDDTNPLIAIKGPFGAPAQLLVQRQLFLQRPWQLLCHLHLMHL
jgi:hypothetical protein